MFEGLLPEEHNENLLTLLFHLGHWHALAKLRMHTEISLSIMDEVTIALGKSLRDFREKTCSAYDTKELQREAGTRRKRQTKAAAAQSGKNTCIAAHVSSDVPAVDSACSNEVEGTCKSGEALATDVPLPNKEVEGIQPHSHGMEITPPTPLTAGQKRKRTTKSPTMDPPSLPDRLSRLKKPLNLNTYKNHSLGDYTDAIRKYGTTDSFSTESVLIFILVGSLHL